MPNFKIYFCSGLANNFAKHHQKDTGGARLDYFFVKIHLGAIKVDKIRKH